MVNRPSGPPVIEGLLEGLPQRLFPRLFSGLLREPLASPNEVLDEALVLVLAWENWEAQARSGEA